MVSSLHLCLRRPLGVEDQACARGGPVDPEYGLGWESNPYVRTILMARLVSRLVTAAARVENDRVSG
jgi:hypothetical protein